MMKAVRRSLREHKRVNYSLDAGDGDSTDSEDFITYTARTSAAQTRQTTVDIDGDVHLEDADSDEETKYSSQLHMIDAMEEVEELYPAALRESRNRHFDPTKAGFLSLPPELRFTIYKLVLVKKTCVDFGTRRGFKHSSGLLSTCKVIAQEAASVLYSMNHFIFRPSRCQIGAYYEEQWRWLGYSSTLQFLTDIGPTNLSHLRVLGLSFQDAAPTDQPNTSGEDRRFQHNADLYRSLELLSNHATNLEIIKLQFGGREKYQRKRNAAALNFGNLLGSIKADVVIISEVRSTDYSTGELWPIETPGQPLASGSSLWMQYWMENRVTQYDEDHFVKRMTREEPLNERLKEKHVKGVKKSRQEGRSLRHSYERYS